MQNKLEIGDLIVPKAFVDHNYLNTGYIITLGRRYITVYVPRYKQTYEDYNDHDRICSHSKIIKSKKDL